MDARWPAFMRLSASKARRPTVANRPTLVRAAADALGPGDDPEVGSCRAAGVGSPVWADELRHRLESRIVASFGRCGHSTSRGELHETDDVVDDTGTSSPRRLAEMSYSYMSNYKTGDYPWPWLRRGCLEI